MRIGLNNIVRPQKRIHMSFKPSINLMARYIKQCTSTKTSFDPEVAKELLARLRQLEWLYTKVLSLEQQLVDEYQQKHGVLHNVVFVYLAKDVPDDPEAPFTLQEELRVVAETFYHCAHRLLVILDQCAGVLPRLGSISAISVRRVRNNLIEHANKKGGRPSYTFSVSNAAGIRLRSAARINEPDTYLDEGLYWLMPKSYILRLKRRASGLTASRAYVALAATEHDC